MAGQEPIIQRSVGLCTICGPIMIPELLTTLPYTEVGLRRHVMTLSARYSNMCVCSGSLCISSVKSLTHPLLCLHV